MLLTPLRSCLALTEPRARAQGYAFPHLTRRLDIAGRHVTAHLTELLRRRGHATAAAASMDAMRQVKERLCYVAADLAREQKVT